jgi:hypothetical protein
VPSSLHVIDDLELIHSCSPLALEAIRAHCALEEPDPFRGGFLVIGKGVHVTLLARGSPNSCLLIENVVPASTA